MQRLRQSGREGRASQRVAAAGDRTSRRKRKFAEDFIEAALERVEGVSNSNVLGGREEELQVVIDPQKLAARGLTITDVRAPCARRTKTPPAATIGKASGDTSSARWASSARREQVENAILSRRNGVPVYVRDVGHAELSYKKPDGFVRRFGSTCIAVNAMRTVGANVLDVEKRLHAAVQVAQRKPAAPAGPGAGAGL